MGVAALAIGSIFASLAGAGMQAYSQSQAMNYQAQVARNNQIVANQNAHLALQQGQVQEQAQNIKTGEMGAAIVAGEAASGVNPNEGSALNVRSSAAETGELDALTIRYNSNIAARNLQYQGSQYGAAASLATAQGSWDIGNSILGGASSVSNKWLQYQNWGIPGFSGSNFAFNPAGPESIMG
jgi:hypothetical protein